MFKFLLAALLLTLTACTNMPTTPVVEDTATSLERIALYWENTTEPRPERKPWSDLIISTLHQDLALYDAAKDITEVCPKYHSLSRDKKLKAMGEFWVATAKHESNFNPTTNSVDVGKKEDLGSYSVGLFQMSANDNSCKKYGLTFTTLKDPLNNINCAMEQMRKQLAKEKLLFLPNSSSMRYWAVLLKGNKYSQIPDIKARVKKYSPACQ